MIWNLHHLDGERGNLEEDEDDEGHTDLVEALGGAGLGVLGLLGLGKVVNVVGNNKSDNENSNA